MTNEELQMKIEHIEKDIKELKDNVKSLPTREEMRADNLELIANVIDKCDERYAPKPMVDMLIKIFVGVIITLTGGIVMLILGGMLKS